MYGTIARMRPKSGHLDEILKSAGVWEQDHAPRVDGFVASYVFQPDSDPDEVRLVVIFEDKERYEANASRPDQDRWYAVLREHLEDDPVWEDGSIIYTMTGSRP